MPSPGLISRAPFTSADLAFLRHLLGPDEGVKQLVFILVRSRFSLRFFSYHVAFCTLCLVAALPDRAVDSTEVDFGARTLAVTRNRKGISPSTKQVSFKDRRVYSSLFEPLR